MSKKKAPPAVTEPTLSTIIAGLQANVANRRALIKAQNRLILQGKALCRQWVDDGNKTKGATLYSTLAKQIVENKADPFDMRATRLAPIVIAQHPLEEARKRLEKDIVVAAKALPIWKSFAADVVGFGALSLGTLIGELGDLSEYRGQVRAIWKRMGLALVQNEDGSFTRQRKCTDADKAKLHGYNPARRSAMFVIGQHLVSAQGKTNPAFIAPGQDPWQTDMPYYAKLFVDRCRHEADKGVKEPGDGYYDPKPDKHTGEPEERFHPIVRLRAQRYVEKRFLRHLYRSWMGQSLEGTERYEPELRQAA